MNSKAGKEILIVEDSEVQAVLLQRMLTQRGFKIARAKDGEEGLYMAQSHKPALIISDIIMPRMDGWRMCWQIKRDPEIKDTPVILLTQLSEVEDVIRGLEAGADYYITKPFAPDFLAAKAEYFIANHVPAAESGEEGPLDVTYAGKQFHVTSGRMRILNLLLSIYENAVEQNKELVRVQQGLATLNDQLEEKVRLRTAALIAEVDERILAEEKLKSVNRALRTLSGSNRALIRSIREEELLSDICRVAVKSGGYHMAWIGYLDNRAVKSARLMAWAGPENMDGKMVQAAWPQTCGDDWPMARASQSGAPFIARDILDNPEFAYMRGHAIDTGYCSCASFPLKVKGVVMGVVNIYSTNAEAFSTDELALLDEMAGDIAYGIGSLRERGAREKAEKQVLESEEKFRLMMEAAQDAVILVDGDGITQSWNGSAERIFGYAASQTLGKSIIDYIVPPDNREAVCQWLGQFKISGSGPLIGKVTEVTAMKADGAFLPVDMSLSSVQIGGKWMAIGLLSDISERKQTEQMLLQSEKMASIGHLAAGIVHEINNPVSYVSSNIGYLKQEIGKLFETFGSAPQNPEDSERRIENAHKAEKEFVEILKESGEGIQRIIAIIRNLKTFTHVSDEKWETADIHKVITGSLNIVRNEIKYKAEVAMQFESKYADMVECIPNQLSQVFINLIVNAGQAIKEKGIISIRTRDAGESVAVEISDTGEGISRENMKRVFEPFFTTKPAGKGTGLGLSLSYKIVQKHGGSINVKSDAGKGTMFTVTLPVRHTSSG